MATRPVFIATENTPYVATQVIEFPWIKGMVKVQLRKRVISLHGVGAAVGLRNIMEISTASNSDLGIRLSAFNLPVRINFGTEDHPDFQTHSVETIYQSSKVGQSKTAKVGPHPDWLKLEGKEVKAKIKEVKLDQINLYQYGQNVWPAEPQESFFTWLYINGLMQEAGLIEKLAGYDGFTDIYFNPKVTNNCQARAAAQAVSMYKRGELELIMSSRISYLRFAKAHPSGHIGKE